MAVFRAVYNLLWGDLITVPLPGGSSLGLSLLVLILVPAGIYFTIRTRFLPFRLFPEMIKVTLENNRKSDRDGISGVQALIVSTACRVGNGQSRWRGCRNLSGRSRGSVLDVGDCPGGIIYRIHRGNAGSAL